MCGLSWGFFWKPGSLQHYLQTTGRQNKKGRKLATSTLYRKAKHSLAWSLGPKRFRITEPGRQFGRADNHEQADAARETEECQEQDLKSAVQNDGAQTDTDEH